jgi:hypothetical protein
MFLSKFVSFPRQHHSTESPCLYIIWEMNNRLAGGRSSEKQSYPTDVNSNQNVNRVPSTYSVALIILWMFMYVLIQPVVMVTKESYKTEVSSEL